MGHILVLLLVANGAPIMARKLFGTRFNWPLDGGYVFVDGRPLFGPAKTCRGFLAAVCATGIAAVLAGDTLGFGMLFGLYTMLGDVASSFIKRRLGIPSSDSAFGLDQSLEALCPLVVLRQHWSLHVQDMLAIVLAFWVLDIVLSQVLYRLHIRQRPY
jgi:CDP-2,3-bis-(O-geranylgeranyl)-sn-glycerol synthase